MDANYFKNFVNYDVKLHCMAKLFGPSLVQKSLEILTFHNKRHYISFVAMCTA